MNNGNFEVKCQVCGNLYDVRKKRTCCLVGGKLDDYKENMKSPLGLIPAKTFYALRLQDINEAIERYVEFGKDIPFEWIREKNSLEEYLNK